MRFLFVDKIDHIKGDTIQGGMSFIGLEPMQYATMQGERMIAPGAISEALGQLASWLCLQRNDFTARPVFLFADSIQIDGSVLPGGAIDMECSVTAMDGEMFTFSGSAFDRATKRHLQTIKACSGYFMPLNELEDPDVTRARFKSLTSGGLQLDGREGPPFPFDGLVTAVTELESRKSIVASCRLQPDYAFYNDHFPRFPVTPIVILNEMIGASAKRMIQPQAGEWLLCREVSGIKIKSFVKPGDVCDVKIQVMAGEASPEGRSFATIAEIHREGKRILRGRYVYELTGVSDAR